MDHELNEWALDPARFDDDGIEPPSRQIIRLAIALAEAFRDEGLPAPDSVVPDPNGGIVFEQQETACAEVLHIWDDGNVEHQLFRGTRLVERKRYRSILLVTWPGSGPGVDDGTEPIADEELLYRRVPASMPWYSPGAGVEFASFFRPPSPTM